MSSPVIPKYYYPPTPAFPVPLYYAPPSPPKASSDHRRHTGSLTGVLIGLFSFFAIAIGVALFLLCRRRRRRHRHRRHEDVEQQQQQQQRETELSSRSRPAAVPSSSGPAAVPSSAQPATVPSRSGAGQIEDGRMDEITEDRPGFSHNVRGLNEADIAALPQRYYNAAHLTDHICGICRKHFVPNNQLLILEPCHHPVHLPCGRTYLRMCRICPTCRVEVLPIRS